MKTVQLVALAAAAGVALYFYSKAKNPAGTDGQGNLTWYGKPITAQTGKKLLPGALGFNDTFDTVLITQYMGEYTL
jgi:hypothetical protein